MGPSTCIASKRQKTLCDDAFVFVFVFVVFAVVLFFCYYWIGLSVFALFRAVVTTGRLVRKTHEWSHHQKQEVDSIREESRGEGGASAF